MEKTTVRPKAATIEALSIAADLQHLFQSGRSEFAYVAEFLGTSIGA